MAIGRKTQELEVHEGVPLAVAYSEELAGRARQVLGNTAGLIERQMFAGLTFMVQSHMCCGIVDNELMVRVGPDAYKSSLSQPHAREMGFIGRSLKGMVYVAAEGLENDTQLEHWIARGLSFVSKLSSKQK